MRKSWLGLGVLALAAGASAQGVAALSAAARPVLVELFTSEGCSSCPPADAMLARLDAAHMLDGRRVIVLSEHVTYWNRLGWVDPYSQGIFTERQAGYSRALKLDEVYTPQVVVDGQRQLVGGDPAGTAAAVRSLKADAADVLRIAEVAPVAGGLKVKFGFSGRLPAAGADLYAAVADDMDETVVPRGENAGRTLKHVSVVRSLAVVGHVSGDGAEQYVTVPVAGRSAKAQRLVLFAQGLGTGAVLGSDMVALK